MRTIAASLLLDQAVLHRGTQQIRAAQASNHPPILWRLEN